MMITRWVHHYLIVADVFWIRPGDVSSLVSVRVGYPEVRSSPVLVVISDPDGSGLRIPASHFIWYVIDDVRSIGYGRFKVCQTVVTWIYP